MKKLVGLLLSVLLAPWVAVGQSDFAIPARTILAQAAGDNPCLADCQQVLQLCKSICEETKARDRDTEYGDTDRQPTAECIQDCAEDFAICQQSC